MSHRPSTKARLLLALVMIPLLLLGGVAPAQAAGSNSVTGRILGPGGALLDSAAYVSFNGAYPGWIDSQGYYSVTGIPDGTYKVLFTALTTANILDEWWENSYNSATSTSVVLSGGSALVLDAQLEAGGTISGSFVGTGGVPVNAGVSIWAVGSGQLDRIARTLSPAGSFVYTRVPPGTWTIRFQSYIPMWRTECWNDRPACDPGTIITMALGQTITGIDAELSRTPAIEGFVTFADGSPAGQVAVVAERVDGPGGGSGGTQSVDGSFSIQALTPGTYVLRVQDYLDNHLIPTYYGGDTEETATRIVVGDGEVVTGITIVGRSGGKFVGHILYRLTPDATPTALYTAAYKLYRYDDDLGRYVLVVDRRGLDTGGTVDTENLEPGSYVFEAWSYEDPFLAREYWSDKRYFWQSDEIVLDPKEVFNLGDVILEPRTTIDIYRVQGADRYETSAEISRETIPPGPDPVVAPVVYVASGLNFPDALAAGPAAAVQGGVLLLVKPTSIPAAVAAELDRLNPQRIVVVGGVGAVSSAVQAQLERYVAHPGDVDRIGGADRYETGRRIIQDAFQGREVSDAFVATGSNYPDALAAGPAAASLGGPVILLNGQSGSLDAQTRALLQSLGVEEVHIAGGLGAVSAGISNQLASLLGGSSHVHRYAGANRYDTGVLMNRAIFSSSDYLLLATGAGFADALGGGPFAASLGAPLYLSSRTCIPISVIGEIIDQRAQGVVLLGGEGALSAAVANLQSC